MKTSKKSEPMYRKGEWVEVVKTISHRFKKGSLAVITCDSFEYVSWDDSKNVRVGAVCQDENGESHTTTISGNELKKIRRTKAPAFNVAWSTRNNDPLMYFKTVKEAKAFVAKLKKRRGEYKEVVEVGIYKRA